MPVPPVWTARLGYHAFNDGGIATGSGATRGKIESASMAIPVELLGAVVLLSLPAGFAAARFAQWQTGVGQPAVITMIATVLTSFVWTVFVIPANYLLPATLLLASGLCTLSAIDVIAFRLPDAITFPLIAGGLLLSLRLPDRDPIGHLSGAVAAYLVFYAIALLYRQVRSREGLGMGDAKLAAAAGAWLGWQALPSVVLIACAVAFTWIGLSVVFRGRDSANQQIAFGVPLCFGFWLVWLYGPPL